MVQQLRGEYPRGHSWIVSGYLEVKCSCFFVCCDLHRVRGDNEGRIETKCSYQLVMAIAR